MRKISATPHVSFPADLDAETRGLLEQAAATAGDVPPAEDIVGQRAASRDVFLSMEGDNRAAASIKRFDVPGRSGAVPVRLYGPQQRGGRALPLVVFLHGGGWSIGDLDCYDGLCADVCAQAGVNILSVGYRLAPETPFPGALEDCLDAIRWAYTSTRALNADPDRFAVMGDSAGGNLAAVAASELGRDNRPPLVAQFLIYPMLDIRPPHAAYASRRDFGNGEFLLSRQNIDDAINWYVAPEHDLADPRLSPTNMPDLSRLPKTYLVSARYDPLFDECQSYARKLEAEGKLASHRVYPSIHAFVSFGVWAIAQTARRDLAGDIRAAFGMSSRPTA